MKPEMTFLKNKMDLYGKAEFYLKRLLIEKVADKKHIASVRVMARKFKSMQEKTQKQIDLFRKNCTHNFEYAGHGHVYDFYDCTECGESEER